MTPERFSRLQSVINKRQDDLTVVLVDVEDPGNVAAIMRTCDSVGIQDIYILNTIVKQERKWKRRSSRGAEKWLSIHQYVNANECFNVICSKYKQVLSTHLSEKVSCNLYDLDLSVSTAFVFGNERYGLDDAVNSYCNGNFNIPQAGVVTSLNISVACAVTLYEAYRQKSIAGHYSKSKLTISARQHLESAWLNTSNDEDTFHNISSTKS